jgi:hypothetical protein
MRTLLRILLGFFFDFVTELGHCDHGLLFGHTASLHALARAANFLASFCFVISLMFLFFAHFLAMACSFLPLPALLDFGFALLGQQMRHVRHQTEADKGQRTTRQDTP